MALSSRVGVRKEMRELCGPVPGMKSKGWMPNKRENTGFNHGNHKSLREMLDHWASPRRTVEGKTGA